MTASADHTHRHGHVLEWLIAVSMLFGRGPAARMAANAAGVTGEDRVIDVGCGPGTAVREAARRGAQATGVDPSPLMLGLARTLTRLKRTRNVTWLAGQAEQIPAPDGAATVVWALSSAHHWDNLDEALREIHRVLAPGGRVASSNGSSTTRLGLVNRVA
jgi:ubiquinone/menaquinone biosynthesis C-methylase UbiE